MFLFCFCGILSARVHCVSIIDVQDIIFRQIVGFTPDVKVWEVCFDKSGSFKEIVRAFELTGHSAGIYHFDFSADSHRSV